MKTYSITLRHDSGTVTIQTRADSIAEAKALVCASEKAPESAVQSWRVIPTAAQIRKTKNLMRGL
jgi:hypothetical protein